MEVSNGNRIDDIEDLGCSLEGNCAPTSKTTSAILPKVKKWKKGIFSGQKVAADSIIPGTQSIYVKTWGCAHNSSDSEYMAGLLAAYGYTITENESAADLWLLNSCTVKNPAEDHFRNAVQNGINQGKQVVVAGCVPQAAPKLPYLQGLSVIGVQQIDRVIEVVEETLKGNSVQLLGPKKEGKKKLGGASLQLPKIRRNPLIEIIAINTGCLNQCTYCKTKHARGTLGSYPVEEIVERAKQAFEEGVREIWLTSEDTGAYGRDIGESLPRLLYQLVEVIPEGCMLRLGMTNPPYILEHLEDMAKILSHPCVYSFLHVPVQSGSDYVLTDMKREYFIEDFNRVVDFLREKVPGITIATDIICGFPTETADDFEQTVALVKEYKFPSLFINQFFPRPGTPAARLKRIPTNEVKQRTKRLSDLFQSYRCYDHKVGQQQVILVTEVSHDKKHFVGHNKFYEQVLIPKHEEYLGQVVNVVITEAGKHHMMGQPLSTNAAISSSLKNPLPRGQVSGLTSLNKAQNSTDTLSKKILQYVFYPPFSTIWLWTFVGILFVAIVWKVSGLTGLNKAQNSTDTLSKKFLQYVFYPPFATIWLWTFVGIFFVAIVWKVSGLTHMNKAQNSIDTLSKKIVQYAFYPPFAIIWLWTFVGILFVDIVFGK